MSQPTAAIILIGNELLSGRTQDANLNYIATELTKIGIRLAEVRVISDDQAAIVEAVNALRGQCDYVFTTGGIGPTHDDITGASIAAAFGVPWLQNDDITARLEAYYECHEGALNAARLRMAFVPQGAELIENSVTAAPGVKMENVYVMAGVPRIMRAMFDSIVPSLQVGDVIHSRAVTTQIGEGDLADFLAKLEAKYRADNVAMDVGSYPFWHQGGHGTSVVIRSENLAAVVEAESAMMAHIVEIGGEIIALPEVRE